MYLQMFTVVYIQVSALQVCMYRKRSRQNVYTNVFTDEKKKETEYMMYRKLIS